MSYPLIEVSQDDGSPVELFEFSYSAKTWRYTSSDLPVTYLTNVYAPLAGLSRDAFEETNDATRASLEITLPMGTEVVDLFRVQPPSEVVTVTVFSRHIEDTDNEFVVIWKGRITNRELRDNADTLTSESVFSSMQRPGLAAVYSRQCRVALYSPACGALKAPFTVFGAVTVISNNTITVPAAIGKPDGYYAGGLITWSNSIRGNTERRGIASSIGATGVLTLGSFPLGLALGATVTVSAGCDHTSSTCIAKFDNIVNFRGEPYIPRKNPFVGSNF